MAQWPPPKYAPVSDTSDIFVLDLSKDVPVFAVEEASSTSIRFPTWYSGTLKDLKYIYNLTELNSSPKKIAYG